MKTFREQFQEAFNKPLSEYSGDEFVANMLAMCESILNDHAKTIESQQQRIEELEEWKEQATKHMGDTRDICGKLEEKVELSLESAEKTTNCLVLLTKENGEQQKMIDELMDDYYNNKS